MTALRCRWTQLPSLVVLGCQVFFYAWFLFYRLIPCSKFSWPPYCRVLRLSQISIWISPRWTGWNQRSGFVNFPLLLGINVSLPQNPACIPPSIKANFIRGNRIFLIQFPFSNTNCFISVSRGDRYYFMPQICFLVQAIWRYVDSAVSRDCEEWRSDPWSPLMAQLSSHE